MVNPGETIGELGVISGEPRSLTVKALMDATLLKLPGTVFLRICQENPEASAEIMKVITKRSLKTIRLISHANKIKFILFFPGNQQTPMGIFQQNLSSYLVKQSIELCSEEDLFGEKFVKLMERLEQKDRQIAVFIRKLSPQLFQLIEKHTVSASFYLVVEENTIVNISLESQEILNNIEKINGHLELVLLNPSGSLRVPLHSKLAKSIPI